MTQIALVTGSNRGIGLEISRILIQKGYTTYMTGRNIQSVQRAIEEHFPGNELARALRLEVTDDDSIFRAAKAVEQEYGKLDLLVNNAGIAFDSSPNATVREQFSLVYNVNVASIEVINSTFAPLLSKSNRKTGGLILNISSTRGSLAYTANPESPPVVAYAYNCSKAALNMLTILHSQMYEGQNIKVLAVCPGYTATGLTKFQGTRSAAESASLCLELIDDNKDYKSGSFWGTPSDKGLSPNQW
ncbi:Carbonyl reductase [NADPH] 3 [Umbelopsis nana]